MQEEGGVCLRRVLSLGGGPMYKVPAGVLPSSLELACFLPYSA
jgi:hypothetical protein